MWDTPAWLFVPFASPPSDYARRTQQPPTACQCPHFGGTRFLLQPYNFLTKVLQSLYFSPTRSQHQPNNVLDFFLTCNKIGAFTLGGGFAMVPVMEREFVEKKQWMSHDEFTAILIVAQTTPGIFAIDMASHIGYKLYGVRGGIVGALGIAIPSIVVILLIALFFHNFKDNPYVERFFRGVRPAVVALIAAPCFSMARSARINRYNWWIPVAACLLIAAFGVSPIWIILAAGLVGYIYGRYFASRRH